MSLEQYQAECAAGKITMKDKQIAELKKVLDRYEKALRKIAKPALGGKEQQWTAQEALKSPARVC